MPTEFDLPAERDFPAGRQLVRATHLASELRGLRRRRRRNLLLVPALAALVFAATGFTTYALTRSEPTVLDSVGCYQTASLRADTAIIGTGSGNPVSACREAWNGAFGQPAPAGLRACVLQTGAIGVFPAACRTLGLAPLSSRGERAARRFARLRHAIESRLGTPSSGAARRSGPCVGRVAAQRLVRGELEQYGYGSWGIALGGPPFSSERPCADVSFDATSRTAILVAAPRG
jgi:hypothetical protein